MDSILPSMVVSLEIGLLFTSDILTLESFLEGSFFTLLWFDTALSPGRVGELRPPSFETSADLRFSAWFDSIVALLSVDTVTFFFAFYSLSSLTDLSLELFNYLASTDPDTYVIGLDPIFLEANDLSTSVLT